MILEILIRKCGSAAVESVIPEKYKGFLKTVLEVPFFPLMSLVFLFVFNSLSWILFFIWAVSFN